MALRFVEYKKDASSDGSIRPLWVDEGETFYNTDNYTFIGCCADDEVKIPDSVTQFANKAALQDRNKAIHAVTPWTKREDFDDHQSNIINLTDSEVEDISDAWWDEIEGLY